MEEKKFEKKKKLLIEPRPVHKIRGLILFVKNVYKCRCGCLTMDVTMYNYLIMKLMVVIPLSDMDLQFIVALFCFY